MTHVVALSDYWWGWGNLLFRWLHVIAAMAWIGASFYFIALDNHLEPPKDPRDAERGVGGEAWEVHGGGFYRVEKFRLVPGRLPEPLYWFKWEAYTTWLSGFALFIVVYYSHATVVPDRHVGRRPDGVGGDRPLRRRDRARLVRLRRALPRVRARRSAARDPRLRVHLRLGLGLVEPVRASSRVHAGRRDDRDDDGRQRLLRDHPRTLGAHPCEGSRARARPALEHPREDALRAQQLPHAAGGLRDALEPLHRSRTGTGTAGSRSSR